MAVEKINFQISKTPQFTDWLEKPGNEIPDDIGIMLSDANQGASEESLEWLKLHVLVTLFCAEKYSHENDWFSKYTMNEHIENLESQLKHASRFNELIKEDPEFGVRFFVNACVPQNSPGKVLFSIPADQYKQIDGTTGIYSIFKTMFLDYKISLKREIDVLRKSKKNPMLIARGGLLCDKNLTKDIGFNSTLFHLAYIFRHFTNKKFDLGTDPQEMPVFGKPRFNLIETILEEDSNNISKHVARLVKEGVYIHPWPISARLPLLPLEGTFPTK